MNLRATTTLTSTEAPLVNQSEDLEVIADQPGEGGLLRTSGPVDGPASPGPSAGRFGCRAWQEKRRFREGLGSTKFARSKSSSLRSLRARATHRS